MLQTVIGKIRRAIEDFNMIDENDKVAIAISGGKDSMLLLYAMSRLQKFYKKKFELIAITINPGNKEFDTKNIEKLCKILDIELIIYNSNISDVVFNIRKEKNPCSLCANMRRGMINSIAVEKGCNKIALAHHSDDVIETLLLSLLLNGKIHTFAPVTYLSRSDIKVIRPMIYVEEKEIKRVIKDENIQISKKCCIQDGSSKREYMKDLIKSIRHDIPRVKENLFGAIKRSNIDGWNQDEQKK